VFRLPELFWNLTGNKLKAHIEYFSADFPIHSVSGFRKKIGHLGFKKLERELSAQRDKAQYLKDSLRGLGSIVFVKEGAEDFVSYPYLSILIKDENMRTPIEKYLSGLGLSRIYLFAISDYKYLEHIISEKDLPSASYIAENSLTISTSKFLNRRDLSRIIDKLKSLKGE
jgi:dTDP-4-amino-4,6-dideoxygalactose transaminase